MNGTNAAAKNWTVTYTGFAEQQEGLREALCTLGNGYMGARGAATEAIPSDIHYPGLYLAGIYNRLITPKAGRDIENEDFVNCPNWLYMSFRIDGGPWFCPSTAQLLTYTQQLDMRRGLLIRRIRFRDAAGRRTQVCQTRLVSMAQPHLAAICYEITPENYNAPLTVRSGIDGAMLNLNVKRYRELNFQHWQDYRSGECAADGIFLSAGTNQSRITVAEAATLRVFVAGRRNRSALQVIRHRQDQIMQELTLPAGRGRTVRLEKTVAVYSSRDAGIADPAAAARQAVARAPSFAHLRRRHESAWDRLWRECDLEIAGDDFSQTAVRLHIFHLLQTASPHNASIDAGMPARGLHGEAYRGHIFWDEAFILPFYDRHCPDITRALLLYRYRRLAAARDYARANGYQGAMFPWQSGSDGTEQTQEVHLNPLNGEWGPDYSRLQRHVSFAIALNVWRHWEMTADRKFLSEYGAELLISIAQFCASLVYFDEADGRAHTKNVMGPDEFHEKLPASAEPGLRDNAYSNVMLVWTLQRAQDAWAVLEASDRHRISRMTGFDECRIPEWERICRTMQVNIDPQGIIEQFSGYFGLKELDWAAYRKKYKNIHRMDRILKAEGKSPDAYKLAKQADVLMLFYFLSLPELAELFGRLGYACDRKMLRKNFDYYLARTSHGSTLSKVVHCLLAHGLGREKLFGQLFREVLASDINDTQGGTTPEGIHCGVMAGSVDIVIRAVCGISLSPEGIGVRPNLPATWRNVRTGVRYRGCRYEFELSRSTLKVRLAGAGKGKVVPLEVDGTRVVLKPGQEKRIRLKVRG